MNQTRFVRSTRLPAEIRRISDGPCAGGRFWALPDWGFDAGRPDKAVALSDLLAAGCRVWARPAWGASASARGAWTPVRADADIPAVVVGTDDDGFPMLLKTVELYVAGGNGGHDYATDIHADPRPAKPGPTYFWDKYTQSWQNWYF